MSDSNSNLFPFLFQAPHFLLDQGGDAVFGQVNAGGAYSESACDSAYGPLAENLEIEYLVMFLTDALFDPVYGSFQEIGMPFLLPPEFRVLSRQLGERLQECRFARV